MATVNIPKTSTTAMCAKIGRLYENFGGNLFLKQPAMDLGGLAPCAETNFRGKQFFKYNYTLFYICYETKL